MNIPKNEIARLLVDPAFDGSLESQSEAKAPIELARNIVTKSTSRLRWLTAITCLAWIAATSAGVGLAAIYFDGYERNMPFHEYRFAKGHDLLEQKRTGDRVNSYKAADFLTPEELIQYESGARAVHETNEMMMILSQFTFLLFGVSALLSIWLITASRRCTMRQINANLASLTLEIKAIAGMAGESESRQTAEVV